MRRRDPWFSQIQSITDRGQYRTQIGRHTAQQRQMVSWLALGIVHWLKFIPHRLRTKPLGGERELSQTCARPLGCPGGWPIEPTCHLSTWRTLLSEPCALSSVGQCVVQTCSVVEVRPFEHMALPYQMEMSQAVLTSNEETNGDLRTKWLSTYHVLTMKSGFLLSSVNGERVVLFCH